MRSFSIFHAKQRTGLLDNQAFQNTMLDVQSKKGQVFQTLGVCRYG